MGSRELFHPRWRALALVGAVALTGCDAADNCLRQTQLRVGSPTGDAMAMLYPGNCSNVALAPQVALSSRGQGLIVLSEESSRHVVSMRWSAAERLELTYRSASVGRPLTRTVVLGGRRFEVVYRTVGLRRVDRARLAARPPSAIVKE